MCLGPEGRHEIAPSVRAGLAACSSLSRRPGGPILSLDVPALRAFEKKMIFGPGPYGPGYFMPALRA